MEQNPLSQVAHDAADAMDAIHEGAAQRLHRPTAPSTTSSAAGFARSVELVSFLARRSLPARAITGTGTQPEPASQQRDPAEQAPHGLQGYSERSSAEGAGERNQRAPIRTCAGITPKARARFLEDLFLDESGCWLYRGAAEAPVELGCALSDRCANPAHRQGRYAPEVSR